VTSESTQEGERKGLKWVLKRKWLFFALWVVVTAVLFVTMPSTEKLVREKGQPQIADEFMSSKAAKLLAEMDGDDHGDKNVQALIVFHADKKLASPQMKEIEQKLVALEKNKQLRVTSMLQPFGNKESEEQLISKDKTTVMAIAEIEQGGRTVAELREQLAKAVQVEGVRTYLTGNEFINEDFAQTSLDGVKKTELLTVLFIITVLVIIFRSPVTPLISLLTVGLTYLVSMATVSHLVEAVDFPFANTTQTFLILVLFGIGTDYNILLFMRFKEELAKRDNVAEAIIATYQTAGKTVFFSGLAVLIGFSMLGFSQFSVYQSGVAVAIGIAFLLLALYTVVPFFMAVMGRAIFWPSRKLDSHGENGLWRKLGHFSAKRPVISIVLVGILAGSWFFHEGRLSFDSLQEVNPDYDSVRGFRIVADQFGPGQTLPTTVVIKNDERLDSPEALAFLDQLHQKLSRLPGVKTVYGPTQPGGEPIDQFYLNDQAKGVENGIGKSTDGLDAISAGLSQASEKMGAATTGDLNQVSKLVDGTKAAQDGLNQVQQAMKQIQAGLGQGSAKQPGLAKGLAQLESGLKKISSSNEKLVGEYMKISGGLDQLAAGADGLRQQVAGIKALATQINQAAEKLDPNDPNVQEIKEKANLLLAQASGVEAGMNQLQASLSSTAQGLKAANGGLAEIAVAQKQMSYAANQMTQGAKRLASGQAQAVDAVDQIEDGLNAINQGQKRLDQGLGQFAASSKQLQSGLSSSAKGVEKISAGLSEANKYLGQVTGSDATRTFFVPEEARKNKDFQKALDMYMSKDRQSAKWTVALAEDPYSEEAMQVAKAIEETVRATLKHSPYEQAEFGVSGVSSINRDLQGMSAEDFSRTVILMLVGIGLMLIVLFRSFWLSLSVIAALVLAYFSSLAVTEFGFSHWFQYPGLSWTVPFFSFIMIIALGVDYSIFVLMRYKEYGLHRPTIAIKEAMKHTGSVVISAAVILCGTFAAMLPSGVVTLLQIATVVILALILLSAWILPLFIPAVIALAERLAQPKVKKSTVSEPAGIEL
jgi:putative drug exporter of the RND superfamily